ncbi:MAG TPA: hypothetical protein VF272_00600 [Candidatus Saccharimonadia bacterium]
MAKSTKVMNHGSLGGVFLATYIGAAVYFLQHTQGFWGTIWALIEALFWPAFIIYHVLTQLQVSSL